MFKKSDSVSCRLLGTETEADFLNMSIDGTTLLVTLSANSIKYITYTRFIKDRNKTFQSNKNARLRDCISICSGDFEQD